ncbi:glycosyltransferase [Tundrisphaera sp. TA3]|uniref:glycosyltransferase n=1 Tax=Tundrisphaera sp. TA3 TaxID=3435775 RepID=UPI003EB81736
MAIAAAVVALGWTALAVRLIRKRPAFRFLTAIDGPLPGDLPAVDAVVPARNEGAHVAGTVAALLDQDYPRLAITVVDDQSTDATAEVVARIAAGSDSVHLVRGEERPAGWVGKTWAVHQGVQATSAGWLWFVDADMGLHPRALATAVHEAGRTGADLVSFLPGATCRTFWQGAIGATLGQILAQLYPLDRVNDPARPDAIAAGGFILVRREAYDRAGGHEACRREIVDDIQLARKVKESGGRLAVRVAPSLAWTHMYGGFAEIWVGLRKNAYAGMDYMPHKYVTGSLLALAMAWIPWIAAGLGLARGASLLLGLGAWGILAQAMTSAPVLVFLGLPWWFAFTLPAGISAYVAIASASVWHYHRGRILWKGREIAASSVAAPAPAGRGEDLEKVVGKTRPGSPGSSPSV